MTSLTSIKSPICALPSRGNLRGQSRAERFSRPSGKVASSRSFRIYAGEIDPNDPMTWNADNSVQKVEKLEPPKVLSADEINNLLTTPMGVSPTSEDGMQVIKAFEETEKPQDAAGAIRMGLLRTEKGDYQGGLEWFQTAKTLPGSGTLRDRKKNRELSDGELMSVSYNMACCHAQLGDTALSLKALKDALETEVLDPKTVREDSDLASLKQDPAFERLLAQYKIEEGGVFGFLGNLW